MDSAMAGISGPREPSAHFEAYDTTGGVNVTGAIVVDINTARVEHPRFKVDGSANTVQVLRGGVMLVTYRVQLSGSASGNVFGNGVLEHKVHGSTAWAAVHDSTVYYTVPTGSTNDGGAAGQVVMELEPGDELRIKVTPQFGSSTGRTNAGSNICISAQGEAL